MHSRIKRYEYAYTINEFLTEETAWEKDIKKHFTGMPKNVWNIWVYGFLEMFNNAIEHSKGKKIDVIIDINKTNTEMYICDDGIGIFKNIKKQFNLIHEKDALLELAKGKRTTDSIRHSGQGIFFTSKVFDEFLIFSDEITFGSGTVSFKKKSSTLVYMCLSNNSEKTLKNIFDAFSTEIPGDFDKTIVPVSLSNSADLVSRSQARRILSGLELFREVILDFKDVEYIGQAFGDEIFRVFPGMYPHIKITAQNANDDVQYMIHRALKTKMP